MDTPNEVPLAQTPPVGSVAKPPTSSKWRASNWNPRTWKPTEWTGVMGFVLAVVLGINTIRKDVEARRKEVEAQTVRLAARVTDDSTAPSRNANYMGGTLLELYNRGMRAVELESLDRPMIWVTLLQPVPLGDKPGAPYISDTVRVISFKPVGQSGLSNAAGPRYVLKPQETRVYETDLEWLTPIHAGGIKAAKLQIMSQGNVVATIDVTEDIRRIEKSLGDGSRSPGN